MKLFELFPQAANTLQCTVTWEQNGFDEFEIIASYEYEGSSHSDHPYGEGSAREYHAASGQSTKIVLAQDVEQYDDNGETVLKTWPKGTNISALPGWTEMKQDIEAQVEQKIDAKVRADSADEEDARYRSRSND